MTWEGRLVAERDELQDRVNKLDAFLKTDEATALDGAHNRLLWCQLNSMNEYLGILEERVAFFAAARSAQS